MSFTIAYDIKAIDKFSDVADKVRSSMDKLEGSVKGLQLKNEKAIKSFKQLGTGAQTAADKMNKSIDKTNGKMNNQRDIIKKNIAMLKTAGSGFETLGRGLMTRVVAPMAAGGTLSLKAAMDMNKGMATIATLLPGQTDRVRDLKSEIQSLATETGASTLDLTEGVYAAISAWGDTNETMERMRVVTKAAQAGLASTGETLSLLSSLSEIYGDNSAEAVQHISDMAFLTNKLAIKAPFADMASSMGRMAPLAKQLGISMEDMFATMTAQAGVTGSVSEVSTQMSAFYASVIKPTPAMEDALKRMNKSLGTSFKTASEALSGLGTLGFTQALTDATNGSEGLAGALGGRKEGLVLAMSLVESRSAKYKEALHAMTTESGATGVAFNEVSNGINKQGFEWEKTKQKMMVMAQRLGDKLLPVMGKLIDRLTPIIDKLSNLDDETIDAAISLASAALKAGLLFTALGKIMTVSAGVAGFFENITAMSATATKGMTDFSGATGSAVANAGSLQGIIAKGGLVVGAAGFGLIIGGYITDAIERKEKREQTFKNKRIKEIDKIRFGKFSQQELIQKRQGMIADIAKRSKLSKEQIEQGISGTSKSDYVISQVARYQQDLREIDAKIKSNVSTTMKTGGTSPWDIKEGLSQFNMQSEMVPEAIAPWMDAKTMAASEQKVKVEIELNGPVGTVGDVKTKTKSKFANVDVGDNTK